MGSTEIDHLCHQVNELMQIMDKLQFENATLRQKIAVNSQEKARLINKNQHAIKRLRQIVKQIKDESHDS